MSFGIIIDGDKAIIIRKPSIGWIDHRWDGLSHRTDLTVECFSGVGGSAPIVAHKEIGNDLDFITQAVADEKTRRASEYLNDSMAQDFVGMW